MSKFVKRVQIPSDRELQIDLDSDRAYHVFKKRLSFFRTRTWAYHGLRDWRFNVSIKRSPGGNRHATVHLSQRMNLCERITAQALLGDDPNRGIYNFFRYLNESRFPVLFYEKAKHK